MAAKGINVGRAVATVPHRVKPWSPVRGARLGREASPTLRAYFQNVAESRPALGPEDEARLAREIEALEVETWQRVLTHASTSEFVLRFLEERLPRGKAGFQAVRAAAAATRKQRTRTAQAQLARAGRPVARRLRGVDRDREVLDSLLEEFDRFRHGGEPAHPSLLRLSGSSKALAEYLEEIRRAAQAGATARHAFVEANLRLVISMAQRFRGQGLSLADLIQEGNLGLMKAVDRFEYRRGLRFSTYAGWWIRHYITRAVQDKSRSVRVPVHVLEANRRVSRVQRQLTNQLGRMPTPEEIADASGFTAEKLEAIRAGELERSISLDEPTGDDERRPRFDSFRDPAREPASPLETLSRKTAAEQVLALVGELDPREVDILRKRYALDGGREWTLQEIGELYHLSRERIRQIEERTLLRLRRRLERHDRAA